MEEATTLTNNKTVEEATTLTIAQTNAIFEQLITHGGTQPRGTQLTSGKGSDRKCLVLQISSNNNSPDKIVLHPQKKNSRDDQSGSPPLTR